MGMDPTIGAALISSGVNFAGGALSSGASGLFGINQARKNRQWQTRMYERQVQDNIKFWNMTNAYNHPAAQLERIREAGLSPLLMYGENGVSGNIAGGMPQSPTAPHGAQANAHIAAEFNLANIELLKAQIENLRANSAKTTAEADESRARTEGQTFINLLNRLTKDVQVSLRYGQLDFLNSSIDKNRNDIFQSSFVNAANVAALSLANSIAIRRQNLSEYEVGQNILMGWQHLANESRGIDAQVRNSFATMMQAVTAAKVGAAQIGMLRATAYKLTQEGDFLRDSKQFRLNALNYSNMLQRKELSWYDIVRESNMSEQDSRIFLNRIQGDATSRAADARDFDTYMLSPAKMLLPFGAPSSSSSSMPMNGYSMPSYSY